MWSALPQRFINDIGIDLGTANTRIHVLGRGIVLSEPSIIALDRTNHSVVAVGHAAKAMLGRTPGGIDVIRPLKDGVIADFDAAQRMLRDILGRVQGKHPWRRARMIIGVPYAITPVEKRAVREAAGQAGAHAVYLVEQPTAAAIGAGLPIHEPGAHVVVDIGGGTTEVAVISLSGIVHCQSTRTAGDELNEAIAQYLKKHYGMLVGERRAEEIKLVLGARPRCAARGHQAAGARRPRRLGWGAPTWPPIPPNVRSAPGTPGRSSKTGLQRSEEGDEIGLLLLGEIQLEARVVEVDHVAQAL